ncbi:MAG: hypothetical protein JJU19_05940 [Pararhodobacter sp.]|nr:hypothetical protein [Pararhodobacter sp.]
MPGRPVTDTRRLRHVVTPDDGQAPTRAAGRPGLMQSVITGIIAVIERDTGWQPVERQAQGGLLDQRDHS